MSTADEMRAITATFTPQGVQETLPLVAAGYVEIPAHRPKYRPIPDASAELEAEYGATVQWLRDMTARNGHCGQ